MDVEKVSLGIMILNSFVIAFAYSFISSQFMRPSRIAKSTCFLLLSAVALAIQMFYSENPVVSKLAVGLVHFLNFVIISIFINTNKKNVLKAANITLSIMLAYSVFVYLLAGLLFSVFPNYLSFEKSTYNIIMQVCVLAFAIVLGKYRNYFFSQSPNIKLLKFNLIFKIMFFIIFNIIWPMLSAYLDTKTSMHIYFIAQLSLMIIIILDFFQVKCVSEIETENRISAVALATRHVEDENVNERYNEIVRFKHYVNKMYASIVGYIETNDMSGLKKYYIDNIAPMNVQLNKELREYKQIEHIKVDVIKARMIELINTVSQLPNVKLYIQVQNTIDKVVMKDLDLFAVLNIFIDNSVEETVTHENGEICIQMKREHDKFIFYIENTLEGYQSALKPKNTHKGNKIINQILVDYQDRVVVTTRVICGSYIQNFEVYDE